MPVLRVVSSTSVSIGLFPQRPFFKKIIIIIFLIQGLTVEERKTCKQKLQSLLGRVYQPIAIKELLVLQGGPKVCTSTGSSFLNCVFDSCTLFTVWPGVLLQAVSGSRLPQAPPWLRRLCGQLLSERLIQPHGVQAVVRAILEGSGGKCGVVKILVLALRRL